MIFIRSTDGLAWNLLSRVSLKESLHGPSLNEDRAGVFRMAALSETGDLQIWTSRDGTAWHYKTFSYDSPYPKTPAVHRTHLFALPDGRLLLLVSDEIFGLQFARFLPDSERPQLDLVARASLEAFAAAAVPRGSFMVALKRSDEIVVRRYHKFNSAGADAGKSLRNWPIYVEKEYDRSGNLWHEITARARVIIPDVTSVGVEPSGRVWWGIESGIMANKDDEFFATDVSQGFFYHYVTAIKGCGAATVWFAANQLDRAVVGYVALPRIFPMNWFQPDFKTRPINGAAGAVTAIQCGKQASQLYVGTSKGSVVGLDGNKEIFRYSLNPPSPITALASDKTTGVIWVGTKGQGLYQLRGSNPQQLVKVTSFPAQEVTALAVDADGALWVAPNGHGLMRYRGERWTSFTPQNSEVIYASIGRLEADPKRGVWYLAHPEARSYGLGYFDGTKGSLYNPPHRILEKPSALAVDHRGYVWVGTWFDGLYRLEPKRKEP